MMSKIKEMNRALLELDLGILFCGLLCQSAGMWLAGNRGLYTCALWMGVLLALLGTWHMYRTLDRALELGDGAAKAVVAGNMLRYGALCIILGIVMVTDVLNPLIVFLGYMTMKVAAYIQPFTHKLCNMLFHETDPVPQPLPEESGEPLSAE